MKFRILSVLGLLSAVSILTTGAGLPANPFEGQSNLSPTVQDDHSTTVVSPVDKVRKAFEESWQVAPRDYLALNEAVVMAGGEPIAVDFPKAGLQGVTAEEAQELAQSDNPSSTAAKLPLMTTFGVPVDAFNVSSVWSGVAGGLDDWGIFTFYASTWDFRDDYVNGSAPDDISAVGIDYPSCARKEGEWATAADYLGVAHNDAVYLSLPRQMAVSLA